MASYFHENVLLSNQGLKRRRFLSGLSASAAALGTLSLRDRIGLQAEEMKKQNRSVILLWMAGAPSQFETFDPKPGTEQGGITKAIATATPGIHIAEGWDKTAQVMNEFSVIRSMTNKEGNHQRATYQLHTGYLPSGSVKHPSLGSNLAKQLTTEDQTLPPIVSVGNTVGSGFLGVAYEPFVISRPGERPDNTQLQVGGDRMNRRLKFLDRMEQSFGNAGGHQLVQSHGAIYNSATSLAMSPELEAFDIQGEPEKLKQDYGESDFGRGCLLARRLVERGVSFVEVRSNGWDTHFDMYDQYQNLRPSVDQAMATLIQDLKSKGMLENTLVVWMGEFGRTPKINARGGRDHYPRVFNALMAGGGVRGGQVIGASTADGTSIKDQPVKVEDLFHSICHSVQVNPEIEHISPLGRPMKIVDGGEVIPGLFG